MPERVGAAIAEARCIRGGADAEGIQDGDDGAQGKNSRRFKASFANRLSPCHCSKKARLSIGAARAAMDRAMSQDTRNVIEKGAAAIRAHFGSNFPKTVLVLGSGIGRFTENLQDASSLSYAQIRASPLPPWRAMPAS